MTNRNQFDGGEIRARAVLRDRVDVKKLSRALIALALAEAQAEADAEAQHKEQPKEGKPSEA
jgi:hypothetical protein